MRFNIFSLFYSILDTLSIIKKKKQQTKTFEFSLVFLNFNFSPTLVMKKRIFFIFVFTFFFFPKKKQEMCTIIIAKSLNERFRHSFYKNSLSILLILPFSM